MYISIFTMLTKIKAESEEGTTLDQSPKYLKHLSALLKDAQKHENAKSKA